MAYRNEDLRDLMSRVRTSMRTGLDVPVEELVIYQKVESEGVAVEFIYAEVDSDGLLNIRAVATWPDGRTDEDVGIVDVTGLSEKALDEAILRCARMAYCRAIDGMYPFEDEDLISPGAELQEMDMDTGDLYPKPPPSPAKKNTLQQVREGEETPE